MLGIDGLPRAVFERFVAEGRMPRFARLLERAATTDLIPTLPALTSPCWLSIASGAYPSTLGVENILLPTPGEAPDVIRNGFDRTHSNAEYLWETLDREGLHAIVLKYPGSWPPRPGGYLQVDGAGGYADITCRFEAVTSRTYTVGGSDADGEVSELIFPSGYRDHWRTHTGPATGVSRQIARPPAGWREVPAAAEPAFELVLPVEEVGQRGKKVLHGLAYRLAGTERVALSWTKSFGSAVAHLELAAPWSDWIVEERGPKPYAYRLKLMELDCEARRLRLYRSAGHRLSGFTQPPELAAELLRVTGPMVEWTGAYDSLNGLVDLETQLEIYRQHTDWMAAAIRHLAGRGPWHGFFTQWHVVEYAHHLIGASLAPDHPRHVAERAERDVDWLGRVYALSDQLLAAVEEVIDDETLLVVTGDHGHDLVHTVFYVNHFLQRRGWLVTRREDGRLKIDWSRSVAYGLFPGCLLLNLAERWPGGIVPPAQAAELGAEICEALRALVDPRTGRRPIKMVLDRDDLAAFGQKGPRAPDLFFCMDRGYEPATRLGELSEDTIELEVTEPYREVTSGHGSFFPASSSARTCALFAGAGVAAGELGRYPISAVDLAPTLAAYLGIPPPRNSEGRTVPLGKNT